jgi:hypothetical protein
MTRKMIACSFDFSTFRNLAIIGLTNLWIQFLISANFFCPAGGCAAFYKDWATLKAVLGELTSMYSIIVSIHICCTCAFVITIEHHLGSSWVVV